MTYKIHYTQFFEGEYTDCEYTIYEERDKVKLLDFINDLFNSSIGTIKLIEKMDSKGNFKPFMKRWGE